ncbi:sensor histidine kinase [Rhodopila globiformis]|uniref:histidine kinase n=1 Tax=Rhodopila globiformis TaxID=1071 RepID=A0A2S6MXD3_RHOGL|nr:ATP-binding protein [Rhodopila globiformis]PPQ27032.1 hypothetical protein CCS01_28250 [Rhodopila globiformis]
MSEAAALLAILGGAGLVLLIVSRQAAWRQAAAARQALDLARLREDEQRRVLDGMPGAVYRIVWPGRDALPIGLFRNQVFATWFGIPQERLGNRGGDITDRLDPPVSRRVTLAVADSGPGIPPGVMHRLFDPFFTTKPSGKGTGLGLSICQGILTKCGGTISTANAPDGGAVFTLDLACWQAEGNAAAEAGAQAA